VSSDLRPTRLIPPEDVVGVALCVTGSWWAAGLTSAWLLVRKGGPVTVARPSDTFWLCARFDPHRCELGSSGEDDEANNVRHESEQVAVQIPGEQCKAKEYGHGDDHPNVDPDQSLTAHDASSAVCCLCVDYVMTDTRLADTIQVLSLGQPSLHDRYVSGRFGVALARDNVYLDWVSSSTTALAFPPGRG
jgi:hypothetical protein